jgi:hypothetical protein
MSYGRKLTKAELDTFLKNNRHGILAFAGKTPYALPMGYLYREKTLLLCLTDTGKKAERLKKNKTVCYTICKPRWARANAIASPASFLLAKSKAGVMLAIAHFQVCVYLFCHFTSLALIPSKEKVTPISYA